jgi:hypothetical protein
MYVLHPAVPSFCGLSPSPSNNGTILLSLVPLLLFHVNFIIASQSDDSFLHLNISASPPTVLQRQLAYALGTSLLLPIFLTTMPKDTSRPVAGNLPGPARRVSNPYFIPRHHGVPRTPQLDGW